MVCKLATAKSPGEVTAIIRQLFRLETSGNEDIYNAIGQRAEVYVPIAALAAQK